VDLYALLGITRAASAGEIERAYRRLLRRFHPGVNPGDRAAADMFRQVQQAFDVLGDLERRRDYDRGAVRSAPAAAEIPSVPLAFEGFDFSFTAEGPMAATFTELFADVFQDAAREALTPTRGADIESVLELSFRDGLRGGHFPVSVLRQERCGSCRGDGRVPRSAAAPCSACGGQGTKKKL
jgi:molecular chaperone DnaJ